MKFVIYSTPKGTYHLINEVNYRAGIREVITCPKEFDSTTEILDYYCTNGLKLEDFLIDNHGNLMSWKSLVETVIENFGEDLLTVDALKIYKKYKDSQEPITLHNTCYIVQSEESIYTVTPTTNDSAGINRWFTRLARNIAFDDCSGERILLITYDGKELHYAGWKPGMCIEFEDSKGNTIWGQEFPEWDH